MRKLKKNILTALIAAGLSPAAAALDIPYGPVEDPPGVGTEIVSGDATLDFTGANVTYIGMDLSKTRELYFGVKNDIHANGFSANGVTYGLGEIFRYQFSTANTITYLAESTFQSDSPNPGNWLLPVSITYTFTGPGEIVADIDTINLNNAKGDVVALWRVDGDFSVNIKVEAQVTPTYDFNFGGFEPANFFVNRTPSLPASPLPPLGTATATSYDLGFYYSLEEAGPEDPFQIPMIGPAGTGMLMLAVAVVARRRLGRRDQAGAGAALPHKRGS